MKKYIILILGIFFGTILPANAYIDPSTGSMLFSIVLSFSSVLFFILYLLYEKIKLYFFRNKSKTIIKYPIVIYVESKRYYHIFKDIINEFENRQYPILVYVSDNDDPFLKKEYRYVKVENIGSGNRAFSKLAFIFADVCLMTTPHLDVFQLKRSKNVKHYSHIFHCIDQGVGYRLFGLDYYDSVLMNFQKSEQYIRELENKRNLKKKELIVVGSTHMDALSKNVREFEHKTDKINVLLAPSWGKSAILANFGMELIGQLSKTQYNIIVRPHPQSLISEKELIIKLQKQFQNYENIQWDFSNNNLEVMAISDILITDFSGIIFDFLFLFNKPCIYSLSSFNKEMFDMSELSCKTYWEENIHNMGVELTIDNIKNIEEIITLLINNPSVTDKILQIKNEIWQKQGEASKNVVDFLIQKQLELSKND